MARVDAVVTGEAELVWAQVLADARQGALRSLYEGAHAEMDEVPSARHDLLTGDYAFDLFTLPLGRHIIPCTT